MDFGMVLMSIILSALVGGIYWVLWQFIDDTEEDDDSSEE